MSLNSLAISRVARDLKDSESVAIESEDAIGPKDVQNPLSALVEYVPAEIITLYIAGIASLPVLTNALAWLTAKKVYGFFAVLTPIMYALIYIGKRRGAGLTWRPNWSAWPYWPMIAATIAFLAWGLAVPDGPFLQSESGRVLAGLAAIFASVLLGVFGRVFAPKSKE